VLHGFLDRRSLDVMSFGARFYCDLGDDWSAISTSFHAPVAESNELLIFAVKHLAICPTLVMMRRSR
jgi:hypothetical protein